MSRLTDAQRREIERLIGNPRGDSSRERDKARTSLKKLGLIHFDRKAWLWVVSPDALAALQKDTDNG